MEQFVNEIATMVEEITNIDKDEITADSDMMDDLNLSSFEALALLAKIEKNYAIKISEREMISISTVGMLAELIETKCKNS